MRGSAAATRAASAAAARVVRGRFPHARRIVVVAGVTGARTELPAGLVDRVDWYVAPLILGDGRLALPAGRSVLREVAVERIEQVGEDMRIVGRVVRPGEAVA